MSEEKKTGSRNRERMQAKSPPGSMNLFDKLESSRSGDKAAGPKGAKPPEKRTQETYSELNELHGALLDDLESSMDRSMQELDARYDKEFSRLAGDSGPRRLTPLRPGRRMPTK